MFNSMPAASQRKSGALSGRLSEWNAASTEARSMGWSKLMDRPASRRTPAAPLAGTLLIRRGLAGVAGTPASEDSDPAPSGGVLDASANGLAMGAPASESTAGPPALLDVDAASDGAAPC